MAVGELVIIVLAVTTFYVFLRYRLLQAVQPYRLELARRGEALLAEPDLSRHHKHVVRFMLDCAFSRHVLLLGVLVTPLVVLAMLVSRRLRESNKARWAIVDDELRREMEEVDGLFSKSIAATSPLLAAVFWIERGLLLSLVAIVRKPFELVDIAADRAYTMYRRHCDGMGAT